MYDELVKKLRSVKDSWQTEEEQWMLDAADAIETMCEMVAEAYQETANTIQSYEETMQRWISVKERLPKEDEVVLVFGGRSIYTAYYGENRWGGIGWHKLNSKYHNCNPTH